jgi:hypothetical protein
METLARHFPTPFWQRRELRDSAGSAPSYFPSIKAKPALYRSSSSFCARARRAVTLDTCHRAPRGVGIFRSVSAFEIAANVIVPSFLELEGPAGGFGHSGRRLQSVTRGRRRRLPEY